MFSPVMFAVGKQLAELVPCSTTDLKNGHLPERNGERWTASSGSLGHLRACPWVCPRPAGWLQPSLSISLHLYFPLVHSRDSFCSTWQNRTGVLQIIHQRNAWVSEEIVSHHLKCHGPVRQDYHSPIYRDLFSNWQENPGVLLLRSSLLQHWKYFAYNPVN